MLPADVSSAARSVHPSASRYVDPYVVTHVHRISR
jgi:hypothetical protein